jgi:hypothetical protein
MILYTLENGQQVETVPVDYTGIATSKDNTRYLYRNGKVYKKHNNSYTLNDGSVVGLTEVPRTYTGLATNISGIKYWFEYGKYHRVDGPAWEADKGRKAWYYQGKLHRTNGPACENYSKNKIWWINGKSLDNQPKIILVCTH